MKSKVGQDKINLVKTEMKLNPKNADDTCNSKYCPTNTNDATPTMKIPHRVPPSPIKGITYTNTNAQDTRLQSIDPSQMMRNQQLARQLEVQRLQEQYKYQEQIRNKYNKSLVSGPAEAQKIRLIMTLQKFQTLGVDYALLNQYFTDCFKTASSTDMGTETVISSFLVFDKSDLVNSATCYTTAIAAIKKTQTTSFAVITSVIDGLTSILKDLRE